MAEKDMTVISSTQMSIQAKVCPRGHVYLYVGHTCLSLRKDEFLDLAQIVQMTEQHLLANGCPSPSEQRH
jgi:hypothetical protein